MALLSMDLYDLKLEFFVGDLTRVSADCIVNSVGRDLNLYNAGELARMMADAAGRSQFVFKNTKISYFKN